MAVEAALSPPAVSTVVESAKVCLNHPVQPEGWGSKSRSLANSSTPTILSFSTANNLICRLSADRDAAGTLAHEKIMATEKISPLFRVLFFCVGVANVDLVHVQLGLIHQASQHHFVSTELWEGVWYARVVEKRGRQIDTKTKGLVFIVPFKLL